jgi:hypothetical protein
MLIGEIRRMADEERPRIADIRTRLIDIGMLLARTSIDSSAAKALDALKESRFLPKKLTDGTSVLVKATDEFAISDHQRYGDALRKHDTLLDFDVDEVQILHLVFQYLGLTSRYLSSIVTEVSTVGTDSIENEELSLKLRAKAYALFW